MTLDLRGPDGVLLERFIESVLLRYGDGKYSLLEATQEMARAFDEVARGDSGFLDHLRGVVEAGDDA